MFPLSSHSPKSSRSLKNFDVSSLISMIYLTFLQVYPLSPTTISIGFCKIDLANYSTFLGKVAENMTV
jgi:hypothetical protein